MRLRLKMLRRFLPVGQGAFYLEQFPTNGKPINIIYDCGSETDVKFVKRQIDFNFDKGEAIEIIFISHMHTDHINGLEYLLQHCKVKNIVMPYTSPEDEFLFTLDYFCRADKPSVKSFTYRFIKRPSEAVRMYSEAKIYRIDEYEGNRDENPNRENEETEEIGEDNGRRISSGKNICTRTMREELRNVGLIWKYIPFNFKEDSKKPEFVKALKSSLPSDLVSQVILNENEINIDPIVERWSDDIKKAVRAAYEKVKGELNTNSMVLFSGTDESEISQWISPLHHRHPCSCFCDCYCYKGSGCLYTGDYDAKRLEKWEELEGAYHKYWKDIGCVQVPHHGSHNNFNKEFIFMNSFFIVSAGFGNKRGHPHDLVTKEFLFHQQDLRIVSEYCGSEVILQVVV